MNALSPLSYGEACEGITDIISSLGFSLFMGETKRKPTVKAVRKQVGAYFNSLGKENKLDLLHAYDAESKAELIDRVEGELLERVAGRFVGV